MLRSALQQKGSFLVEKKWYRAGLSALNAKALAPWDALPRFFDFHRAIEMDPHEIFP